MTLSKHNNSANASFFDIVFEFFKNICFGPDSHQVSVPEFPIKVIVKEWSQLIKQIIATVSTYHFVIGLPKSCSLQCDPSSKFIYLKNFMLRHKVSTKIQVADFDLKVCKVESLLN